MKKKLLFLLFLFLSPTYSVLAEEHQHQHEPDKITGTRTIDLINENLNEKNRYSPAVVVAKKGEKVILNVFNTTNQPHGFSIDEFNVKETLNPKQNKIEFFADKSGLFSIYCQFHPAHLRGQLLIID